MIEKTPVAQNQRMPIIDILRGWALFSVIIINYLTIYNWNNHSLKNETDNFSKILENTSEIILGSKGWSLLAILFGYGFSVLLKNISRNCQPNYLFFIKKMLWLLIFGIINTIFFGGDILHDYALLGLILLLFYGLSYQSLFIIGVSILLLTPFLQSFLGNQHLLFLPKERDNFYQLYDNNSLIDHIKANFFMRYRWMLRLSYSIIFHLIQLGCLLIGFAMHRSNFLLAIQNNLKLLKRILIISLVLSITLFLLQFCIKKFEWKFNEYYNLYYPEKLFTMVFTSSFIVCLYFTGKAKKIFSALQTVGKMTLTNYLMQNIISFVFLIYLKPHLALYWYLIIACIVYIVQVFISKWWLKKYNYGILEWLWRCLSYGRIFQLKKIRL
jgi:uncharacterized protein